MTDEPTTYNEWLKFVERNDEAVVAQRLTDFKHQERELHALADRFGRQWVQRNDDDHWGQGYDAGMEVAGTTLRSELE